MREFKEMVSDESAQMIPPTLAIPALPAAAAPALAACAALASAGLAPAIMGIMVDRSIVFRTGSSSAALCLEEGESEFKVMEGEPKSSNSKSLTIEADNPGDIMGVVRPLMEKNPIRILPLLLSGKVKIGGSIITALRFRKVMNTARTESSRQRRELYGF